MNPKMLMVLFPITLSIPSPCSCQNILKQTVFPIFIFFFCFATPPSQVDVTDYFIKQICLLITNASAFGSPT